MIKYVELDGYDNYGESAPFSHIYQFMQRGDNERSTILVHAYECDTEVFKGYLFHNSKTYKSIPLTDHERTKIEGATGKLSEVPFHKFIEGTSIKEFFADYTEL